MQHDLICIGITAVAMLMARYVWDRWLSKSSRVTKGEYEKDMICVNEKFEEGACHFKTIQSFIAVSCLIQLEFCAHSKIDCKSIKDFMVENGIDL